MSEPGCCRRLILDDLFSTITPSICLTVFVSDTKTKAKSHFFLLLHTSNDFWAKKNKTEKRKTINAFQHMRPGHMSTADQHLRDRRCYGMHNLFSYICFKIIFWMWLTIQMKRHVLYEWKMYGINDYASGMLWPIWRTPGRRAGQAR